MTYELKDLSNEELFEISLQATTILLDRLPLNEVQKLVNKQYERIMLGVTIH